MDQLPSPRVFVDVNRIGLLLQSQFDVTVTELQAIASSIFRAFIQVTSLHPKGFNGTNGWAEGTSEMRATMIPKGWHAEDPQGQPRVVSKDKKTSITLSSGNSDTGVPNRIPQTRNDKGTQTASSVRFNANQGQLFPLTVSGPAPLPSQGQSLWIFLYHIDFDAREMRFELSQPTAMSDADKVNGWSTRYILPPLKFGPDVSDQLTDEGPDIDFEIIPKLS